MNRFSVSSSRGSTSPRLTDWIRRDKGIDGTGSASHNGLIPLGQKAIEGMGTADVFLSLPNEDEATFLFPATSVCRGCRTLNELAVQREERGRHARGGETDGRERRWWRGGRQRGRTPLLSGPTAPTRCSRRLPTHADSGRNPLD